MCELLSEWMPSKAALDLVKLNGVDDAQIQKILNYLKSQENLSNIDDVDGYDNWNALFIVFCVKVNKGKSN